MVINNVGLLSTKQFFAETPQLLQDQMHVNNCAIVLNTALALRHFSKQKDNALIQLSSFSGLRYIVGIGSYGATKKFDQVFANLVDKTHIQSCILRPGLVATPMTKFAASHNSCLPDETVNGTLRDLSHGTKWTHGSFIHSIWGVQMAWTPDSLRHFQRLYMGQCQSKGISSKQWIYL